MVQRLEYRSAKDVDQWIYCVNVVPGGDNEDVPDAQKCPARVIDSDACRSCGNRVEQGQWWCPGHRSKLRQLEIVKTATESKFLQGERSSTQFERIAFLRRKISEAFYKDIVDRRIFRNDDALRIEDLHRMWKMLAPNVRRGRQPQDATSVQLDHDKIRVRFIDGMSATCENSIDAVDESHKQRIRQLQSMVKAKSPVDADTEGSVDGHDSDDEPDPVPLAFPVVDASADDVATVVNVDLMGIINRQLESAHAHVRDFVLRKGSQLMMFVDNVDNSLCVWYKEQPVRGYDDDNLVLRLVKPFVFNEKDQETIRHMLEKEEFSVLVPYHDGLPIKLPSTDLDDYDAIVALAHEALYNFAQHRAYVMSTSDALDILTATLVADVNLRFIMRSNVEYVRVSKASTPPEQKSVLYHSRLQQRLDEEERRMAWVTPTGEKIVNSERSQRFPEILDRHTRTRIENIRADFDSSAAERAYSNWSQRCHENERQPVLRRALEMMNRLVVNLGEVGKEMTAPISEFIIRKLADLSRRGSPSTVPTNIDRGAVMLFFIMVFGPRHSLSRALFSTLREADS